MCRNDSWAWVCQYVEIQIAATGDLFSGYKISRIAKNCKHFVDKLLEDEQMVTSWSYNFKN